MKETSAPLPILISFTMYKVPNDDFAWVAKKITTQGDKVLDTETIGKPNIRAIVEEQFRIAIARTLFK